MGVIITTKKPQTPAVAPAAPAAGAVSYQDLYRGVCQLSSERVTRLFGVRPNDPRFFFLAGIEEGRLLARVELNAISRLLTEVLGIESTVFMRYLREEMEAQLKELGVDPDGSKPVGE